MATSYPPPPTSSLGGPRAFDHRVVDAASRIRCRGCGAEDHGKIQGHEMFKFSKLRHATTCPYAAWVMGFK